MGLSRTETYPFTDETNYEFDSDKIAISSGEASLILSETVNSFEETFASDAGFTYDSAKAEFSGGQVQQKLNDITGLVFSEDFANDTGFTYESNKAEFTGGLVRQINKRPADAVFYASFNTDENANWTDIGTGVGTLSDGATVHDGVLDLTGYVADRRLSINAYDTSHDSQKGCMRCRFKPEYSDAPSQHQYIMQWRNGGIENNIQVLQNTNRFIQAWIRDGVGNNILATASFGVFNFVAGQTYEIEFNWDCDLGEHRMFIDGIQLGSTQSGTGTRDGRVDQFDFGVYYNNLGQPNFSIDEFIYFNAVQHTSDYTPDWSNIYEYDYLNSTVELPTMTYSGNSIGSFVSITGTESGTPKYILDDKYWSGSAWVSSNGSYSQANTLSEVNTNIASLTPTGKTLNVDVVFDNSMTQSSVDQLTINYVGQNYLATSVVLPEMEYTGDSTIISFDSFSTVEGGSPRYTIQIGRSGNYLYWDGSAWSISDDTYIQSNDSTTFNANVGSLTVLGEKYGQFRIHFTDTSIQGSVDNLIAVVTAQTYPKDNPTIKPLDTLDAEELESYTATVTVTGSDLIKQTIEVDGVEKYWDGATWSNSTSYIQTNTVADMLANIASLDISNGAEIRPVWYLHSEDGMTTPSIDSAILGYTYFTGEVNEYRIGFAFKNPDLTSDHHASINFSSVLGSPDIRGWGKILTEDEIRYVTGFGTKLVSPNANQTYNDAHLMYYVEAAIGLVERGLDIDILPRTVRHEDPIDQSQSGSGGGSLAGEGMTIRLSSTRTERQDLPPEREEPDRIREEGYPYRPNQARHYLYVKLRRRPLRDVLKAVMVDPVQNQVIDMYSWRREFKGFESRLQFFPNLTAVGNYPFIPGKLMQAQYPFKDFPSAIYIDYKSGYANAVDVPHDLRLLIYWYASYLFLIDFSDGIATGVAASSVNLNSISESLSTTMSATNSFYGARIAYFKEEVKKLYQMARHKYQRAVIGVL